MTSSTTNTATSVTLDNGLAITHIQTNSPIAWCSVAVNAGSRDDPDNLLGLAHFVEHTIFKGTTHRRARHITNRIETVGGELNAFTTKEYTNIYTTIPAQHLSRAIQLLADLIQNSVFPTHELDRERDVILEEVAAYQDSPAEAIYDDVEDILFANSQLGHNILGTAQHIKRISTSDCLNYLHRYYTPNNMVLTIAAPQSAKRVINIARRQFSQLHSANTPIRREKPPVTPPQRITHNLNHLHQAHTIIAIRLPDMFHPLRHALSLLNNILGGPSMNSLLNAQLREKHGFVYNVDASLSLLSDCGMMQIYFGCDPTDTNPSLKIIDRITQKLATQPLTPRQLQAAKQQYCGQLLLAADSTEWIVNATARAMLYYKQPPSIHDTIRQINSLTPEHILQAAQLCTLDKATILTYQ